MAKGTVKWFNKRKGFGFISDDSGPDVFVHFTDIDDQGERVLREGEMVEYEMVQGEKGPKAAKVIRKEQV